MMKLSMFRSDKSERQATLKVGSARTSVRRTVGDALTTNSVVNSNPSTSSSVGGASLNPSINNSQSGKLPSVPRVSPVNNMLLKNSLRQANENIVEPTPLLVAGGRSQRQAAAHSSNVAVKDTPVKTITYDAQKMVGQGTFGSVYLAKVQGTDEMVAIKKSFSRSNFQE